MSLFKKKVVLLHHGDNKVQCIKAIRIFTGLGLKEAKQGSETPNWVVATGLDRKSALALKETLINTGASAEVR